MLNFRKISITLGFCAFVLTMSGQSTTPFDAAGNSWITFEQPEIAAKIYYQWKIGSDTQINGLNYRRLNWENQTQGFVRQTADEKVYFVPAQNTGVAPICNHEEQLLYDFKAQIGDRLVFHVCMGTQSDSMIYVLEAMDTMTLFGADRVRLRYMRIEDQFFYGGLFNIIIVGIGNMETPLQMLMTPTEGVPIVVCYNGAALEWAGSEACTLNAVEPETQTPFTCINPIVGNQLQMAVQTEVAAKGYRIILSSLPGQVLYETGTMFSDVPVILLNRDLPPGMYFASLVSGNRKWTKKVINRG